MAIDCEDSTQPLRAELHPERVSTSEQSARTRARCEMLALRVTNAKLRRLVSPGIHELLKPREVLITPSSGVRKGSREVRRVTTAAADLALATARLTGAAVAVALILSR